MEGKKEKRHQYGDGMEYWIFLGIVGSTQFIVTHYVLPSFSCLGFGKMVERFATERKCVPIHSNY